MNHSKILIASLHKEEAITNCLIKNKDHLSLDIDLILIRELLEEYNIYDILTDQGSKISWSKNNKNIISNDTHLLFNRLTHIPKKLFEGYEEQDRDYARREFEAYLGYAFNSFIGAGNHNVNGVCMETLSLPQQWQKVKNVGGLQIPNYYWGPMSHNTLNNDKKIIYSTIYDFLNWSKTSQDRDEHSIFCFERPLGEPIIVLTLGDSNLIVSDSKSIRIDIELKILLIIKELKKIFNYFVGEILFFVNEGDVIFGCLNQDIVVSNKNPYFESFVCDHFKKEYYKWVN